VSTILPIFVLWFSHILTMGVGAYVVTGEYTPTCLIFFYKVLGIVKGMLYLCIVMYHSIIPQLIENKKFLSSFNKKLKDRPFTFKNGNYGVDGYPQLKVVKGQIVFKVFVSKGYVKYYRQEVYTDVLKTNRLHRRLSNRVRNSLGYYLHCLYGKHFGIKQHEITVSLSWV
jgi:hypothetical protein